MVNLFSKQLKRGRIFCLFLMLIVHNSWSAQIEGTQSLFNQAEQIRSSDPVQFIKIIEKLKQREELLTKEQYHHLKYLTGYSLSFQGKFDEALTIYKNILISNAQTTLKLKANLSIVNTYAISKQWPEGLYYLSDTLNTLPKISDNLLIQRSYAVAAIFYNQLGQYELGMSFADKLLQEPIEGRTLCVAHNLKLESLFKLELLEEDDPQIREGIEACQQSNEVVMESAIYSYLATLYLKKNNPHQAISILESNFDSLKTTKYVPYLAIFNSLLSQAHHVIGANRQAEEYALVAIDEAKNINISNSTVNAYRVLYQIAESRGDHKMALEYHKKYAEADKAYLDDIKTKHLAFQLAEHQAAEQKSRIGLLDKQNNLLKIEQRLARSEAENNRLFIALLIAIITLLSFWGYKSWMTQKRLKQLAEFDALTGVFNRGHFTQLARSALQYCENSDIYLSCILFDLDKFKSINDSYGHACGDWVLKRVADVCKVQGRSNDIFARLGGEEFCILLPGCDLMTATRLAETCRKAIAQIDTLESGAEFMLTASFGVTDAKLSGYDLEKLTADADMAMYQSKRDGRNRTTVFGRADSGEKTDLNSAGKESENRQGQLTL